MQCQNELSTYETGFSFKCLKRKYKPLVIKCCIFYLFICTYVLTAINVLHKQYRVLERPPVVSMVNCTK